MEEQEEITKQVRADRIGGCGSCFFLGKVDVAIGDGGGGGVQQARKFAKAMKAPLIFTSASHSINVQKVFKVVLSKVFDLKCTVPIIDRVGDPILQY